MTPSDSGFAPTWSNPIQIIFSLSNLHRHTRKFETSRHRVSKLGFFFFFLSVCLHLEMASYDEVNYPENYGEDEFGELEEEEKEEEEDENLMMCRAFTLLDIDGDGVIEQPTLEKLLVTFGRLPMNEELDDILSYAQGTGCEGAVGMDFQSFREYFEKQLADTNDEAELREAFEVFDSTPLTGKLNVTQLRHYLKQEGMKLTDDEIDFFFREEDYWMLEEKYISEYEDMINKLLDRKVKTQFLKF